jgi:uncharacterized iron-regulated membrane protein
MAAGIPLHQADTGVVNLAVNVLFCLAVLGMVWRRAPPGWRAAPRARAGSCPRRCRATRVPALQALFE